MKDTSRPERLSRRETLQRLGYTPPAVVWVSSVAFSAAPSQPPPPPGTTPPPGGERTPYPRFGQQLRFEALGQAVAVELESRRQRRVTERLFGGFAPTSDAPVARFALARGRLLEDGEVVAAGHDEVLLEMLEYRVASRVMAAQLDRVALHASAVVRRGRAVVLPGAKQRGKTTLAARLVQGGYALAADDCTVLDPDSLSVLPFPRPLNVKPGSAEVLAPWGRRFDVIRARRRALAVPVHDAVARAPAAPAVVAFPQFRAGAPCRIERLDANAALAALVESTFDQTPRELGLATLARLAETTPAYRIEYGDARDAVSAIRRWA